MPDVGSRNLQKPVAPVQLPLPPPLSPAFTLILSLKNVCCRSQHVFCSCGKRLLSLAVLLFGFIFNTPRFLDSCVMTFEDQCSSKNVFSIHRHNLPNKQSYCRHLVSQISTRIGNKNISESSQHSEYIVFFMGPRTHKIQGQNLPLASLATRCLMNVSIPSRSYS